MPAFEKLAHHEKVLLYRTDGTKDKTGQFRVTYVPEEIKVRWEADSAEITNAVGQSVKTDVALFTNEDVPIGSIVWYGGLDDLTGTSGIDIPEGDLFMKIGQDHIKDIKGRNTTKVDRLMRFGNVMPPEIE